MRRVFYVYQCAPLDYGWDLMQVACDEDDALQAILEAAERSAGWEGDFAQVPRVFAVPNPESNEVSFGYAWKQDNNGTTFVAAPFAMPHLGTDCIEVPINHYEPHYHSDGHGYDG